MPRYPRQDAPRKRERPRTAAVLAAVGRVFGSERRAQAASSAQDTPTVAQIAASFAIPSRDTPRCSPSNGRSSVCFALTLPKVHQESHTWRNRSAMRPFCAKKIDPQGGLKSWLYSLEDRGPVACEFSRNSGGGVSESRKQRKTPNSPEQCALRHNFLPIIISFL